MLARSVDVQGGGRNHIQLMANSLSETSKPSGPYFADLFLFGTVTVRLNFGLSYLGQSL